MKLLRLLDIHGCIDAVPGRTTMIAKDALLHVAGHAHSGMRTRNYLNTGFLHRDGSNGAVPMMGRYFYMEITGRAVDAQFHEPGPMRRVPLKSPGFKGDVHALRGRARSTCIEPYHRAAPSTRIAGGLFPSSW